MGLETDPKFATNHRFYTCQGGTTGGGGHEVKVMAWKLNDALTSITGQQRLVGGFPTSSGRHGGCRLLALADGSLYVGTGDAAQGTNPENKRSLGGKTLRLDAQDRQAVAEEPLHHVRTTSEALRADLRPPQRPGPGLPQGQGWRLVDRAGHLPRRRGQRAPQRRRLRLQPGAGLQRGRADDRPVAAGQAAQRPAGAPATRRSRPPAAASSTARAGASTTATSPSPRSRPSG